VHITTGTFLVLFSDLSNNMALTAALGRKSASGELERVAPDLLLYNGLAQQLSSTYTFAALAAGQTQSLASQTAIAYFITNVSDCNLVPIA
jgi:hypothetical protein